MLYFFSAFEIKVVVVVRLTNLVILVKGVGADDDFVHGQGLLEGEVLGGHVAGRRV